MKRLAVIGAGPIGLHAALQAVEHGYDVTVLERGEVGAAIRRWSHVRLFTPFEMNSTEGGRHAVAEHNTLPPADALLTGDEYLRQYLLPLSGSNALRGRVHTSTRLIAASREACGKSDLIGRPERAAFPFRLLLERDDETEGILQADLLLDCTGLTSRHRPVGIGGIPCPGERDCLTASDYEIPGPQRQFLPEEHVVVIGSGYSAATTVCQLAETCQRVTWITRGNRDAPLIPLPDDPLTERRQLTDKANLLATDGSVVQWLSGAQVESLRRHNQGYELRLSCDDGRIRTVSCEQIIANAGYRPDTRPFEELQIHRCYATEGPIRLAAHLLGEASADCLSQSAPDCELLRNPEPGFFILGAASYGRDSRFLLKNGLDQLTQLFDSELSVEDAAT